MLCFNYFFLPPIGTFTIADPQNWVALFAFLATSLTASQLSARAKRRTKEAIDRQHEMERLYSLSRALLLTGPDAAHGEANRSTDRPGISSFQRSLSTTATAMKSIGRQTRRSARHRHQTAGGGASLHRLSAMKRQRLIITPIRLGGEPIGSLAMRGASLSDAALQSLLNLVAIGLERALAQEAVNRAEVARQK